MLKFLPGATELRTSVRKYIVRPHRVAHQLADAMAGVAELLDAVGGVVHDGPRWKDLGRVLHNTATTLRVLWRLVEMEDGSYQEHGPDGLRDP